LKQVAAAIHHPEEQTSQARALAELLDLPATQIDRHGFPDGESLIRVRLAARTAVVLWSLDRPNGKLVELMLTADALRRAGAARLVLVAPYLCYMRQDAAFQEGEAVSQQAVGRFLAQLFDSVITVDPHLHRTKHLSDVFPGSEAVALSSCPLLAEYLADAGEPPEGILIGPDGESRQWVEAIAAPLGLPVLVGEKQRLGDRKVRVTIPGIERTAGKPVVLVDDVVSTGRTLIEAASLLKAAGASSVSALVVHLLDREAQEALRAAGVARVTTTDSIDWQEGRIPLAPLLAPAVGRAIR
jgi:ribose-phosphate pyrophosphokinase